MERLIDNYLRLMAAALFAVFYFAWPLDVLSLVALWIPLTLAIPAIAAVFTFAKFNSKPDDPNIWPKPYPSQLHVAIVATSRVCFRRNLPRSISRPLNVATHTLCKRLFDTRTVPLARAERCVFSQFGEDGASEAIFDRLGHGTKFYVEFGTEDASECNTRYLREQHGWTGLLMDGGHDEPAINLHKEHIYPDNVEALFAKYHVPHEFDYLVIDIDSNDFWVWRAISTYRPRVVCMENNAGWGLEDKVVKYDRDMTWNFSNYHGASITAYTKLAKRKGYSLVHCTLEGLNLFFVRDDLVPALGDLVLPEHINSPQHLYMRLVAPGPHGAHMPDPERRQHVTSDYQPPELELEPEPERSDACSCSRPPPTSARRRRHHIAPAPISMSVAHESASAG